MEKKRFQNWWFLGINGLIVILFGLLMLLFTPDFMKVVILYLGLIILGSGIVLLIAGIRNIKKDRSAAVLIFESIIAIAVGIALAFFPLSSLNLFVSLIGVWLIVTSFVQMVFLYKSKDVIKRKPLFIINSLLTLALGILLFFVPFAWGIVVKFVGILAILLGILLIYFSFVVRSVKVKEVLVGNAGEATKAD